MTRNAETSRLVLADGTVFDGQYLAKNSEFGHFERTKSGILEKI